MKKVANILVIINCLVIILIICFFLFGLYNSLTFAISLAIITPITGAFVMNVINYYSQNFKTEEVENKRIFEDTKSFTYILLFCYVFGLLGIILIQALKAQEMVTFISVLGGLELGLGIFLNKLIKSIYN